MAIVTGLNLLKCVCITYTHYLHRRSARESATKGPPYLVTIGDAIASFLQDEDKHTMGFNWATKRNFDKGWPSKRPNRLISTPKSEFWFRAASKIRWGITMSLCIALITIVGFLLGMTISSQRALGVPVDLPSLWSYGVGASNQWATSLAGRMRQLSQTSGFFFAVLFANMFQVIVSALYLLYNNLLTVLVMAAEWNDFISERKTLRLSAPRGIQRSGYFLSLPYRYSIILMTCSGLLHWLISQSVFIVQTVAYNPEFERNPAKDASSIGYSSIGIMFAMTIGSVWVLALLVIGFTWRYTPTKPRDGGPRPPFPMPLANDYSTLVSV
ncbi:hypothetical protein CC86DRAFT_462450 [Ophiobolus disseminans]|uniref:Uncharacterized protein n=1 Tax=Ophiobolus disseminans TaxID=1469910 RepID=A0A6A7AH71_9PLEO|nr:hypothetical protein CC86DRAFT_462450 [Ophiobolus disseminans]